MLFLPFCLWLEDRRPSVSLQTDEAVTYSPDSYCNGAVSAPRLTAHLSLLTENLRTSMLSVTLSLVPFHPERALNSKVTDNPQDRSAVMAGDRLFRKGRLGDEEQELPFSQACGWSTQSSILGWTENQLRAHRAQVGTELSGRPTCSAMVGVSCRPPVLDKAAEQLESHLCRPRRRKKLIL